jgi:serine/threonine protein kinase/Tol biopolymer transport system component
VSLATGTKLGPYEILAAVGAGGMGEVYRARDPRLGRDVAIKVVLAACAADGERVHRFEQEARAAAALNHPNILAVYDIGQHDGAPYVVSELLEGDTLRERLNAGPAPVRKALDHSIQIARGLAAAHEKGIVHRDLKPENVFVTSDGRVKILDFGLAKLIETEPAVAGMSALATVPPQTLDGLVLGTVGYMSPEQARGLPADHRADIFAFGAVLYEMLSGRRAFQRDTGADTMIAIVRDEPADLPVVDRQIPPALQRLLSRCLEKSPAARFQSASDMAFALEALSSSDTGRSGVIADQVPDARSHVRWARAIPWALAVASIAVAVVAISAGSRRDASTERSITRLELNLPPAVELYATNGSSVTISPDGRSLAFNGAQAATRRAYVRRLDQSEFIPLRGLGLVLSLVFSPDGESIGLTSGDGTVKKVSLKDGVVVTIARAADLYSGITWGPEDRIVFGSAGTLWEVRASGGTAKQLTTLDTERQEISQRWPALLPDGRTLLFTCYMAGSAATAHIEAVSLATGAKQIIVERAAFPIYAPTGHLLFLRDGAIQGAPFDVATLKLTGAPVRLVDKITVTGSGAPIAALSSGGTFAYVPGVAAAARLVWVSRKGVQEPLNDTPQTYGNPRVAPDGQRIVVVRGQSDLWIQDIARPTFTRLTPVATNMGYPVWTPDGQHVLFRTLSGIHRIRTDGSGRDETIPGTSTQDLPASVSPDGETLAFVRLSQDTSADVYALSLHGEPRPYPIVKTAAYEGGPQFSPDGHWMTYTSDESGQMQVYVRPFPGPDRNRQVSTSGGTHPQWSRTGKELFYRDGDKMMMVDVSTNSGDSDLALSSPKMLFEQRYSFGGSVSIANYDVSPDGQRFVMVKEESSANRLNVVLNWFEELKRRVPTK